MKDQKKEKTEGNGGQEQSHSCMDENNILGRGIFITGTGTDMGKTYISGLIAKKLTELGVNVGYFKAAVSGNEVIDGKPVPGDALCVKQMAGLSQKPEDMVPYVYEHAYSPHLAARLEGNPVSMEKVMGAYAKCAAEHDFILAEGSGGILCPIRYEKQSNLKSEKENVTGIPGELWLEDIIKATGLPAVIVADAGLGTINNVLLTVYYMERKGLSLVGIILNHYEAGNILHEDNREMIAAKTGLPILACVEDGAQDIKSW